MRFLLIALVLLCGCQGNLYEKFYTPIDGVVDVAEPVDGVALYHGYKKPKGMILLGTSQFEAENADDEDAVAFAKTIGASAVVIHVRKLRSEARTGYYTVPVVDTAYHFSPNGIGMGTTTIHRQQIVYYHYMMPVYRYKGRFYRDE